MILTIDTPRWALPLYVKKRYKGAKGGRASGKSHERAEALVERMICEPDLRWVCIREIQKSLKFSSKQILEDKIKKFNVSHLFDVTLNEIRRIGGDGIIIFQGMQDHTADSIKSLEGFDGCWVEEAQSMSKRSLDLLDPTIRKAGSELWFTWNPDKETDAVEQLFKDNNESVLVHVNYTDNKWVTDDIVRLAKRSREKDYEEYRHIWLGEFNTKSKAQIFLDRYTVCDFELDSNDGLIQGLDFGFSQDPTAAIRAYVQNNNLYITNEYGRVGLEIDHTKHAIDSQIPNFSKYKTIADNARPESISLLLRSGMRIEACKKGKGSVEDGIEFIKSFDNIYIHERCEQTINEFVMYSYKIDKITGDVLPDIVDANNHFIDALRYGLEPLMKANKSAYTSKRFF